jgi:hypothetical protein
VRLAIAAVALATAAPDALAAEEAATGRAILERWQEAVVTARLAVEMRWVVEGREFRKSESRAEIPATVIDPSGLSVCSLSSTDPGGIFTQMMERMGDPGMKLKIESKITDVKLRLAGGQELPAQIVLRDKDLDLAFLRPTTAPAKPLLALDLAAETRPLVLDPILVLSRLGREGSWASSASLGRVIAIIERPRRLYVPEAADVAGQWGTPAFTLDGKVVGMVLLRTTPSSGDSLMVGALGGMGGLGMQPVILPAADVREAAKQAPAVEPPLPSATATP